MKANQAFSRDDEAVSPVIGVILMVAITVVLAAVVFVLVTRLANNQQAQSPTVSWDKVDAAGTTGGALNVVRVQGGVMAWSDLGIVSSSGVDLIAGGQCAKNDGNGDGNVNAAESVTCTIDGPISIRVISTNTLIYTTTFHT